MANERQYERRVVKGFRGKEENEKLFVRNSKFRGSKKRVDELTKKGHLAEVETAVPKNDKVETASAKTETKKAANKKEGE
ncbi:hypothetical protein [Salinicoccus carnicancri]|uniref:hypothetical protein n=1 Tax=Salinicoccus carnicancri TaxID=558170 RepID=UPI0002D2E0C6|nr:hypothetical protein [Salinicoccus carnicancri]